MVIDLEPTSISGLELNRQQALNRLEGLATMEGKYLREH